MTLPPHQDFVAPREGGESTSVSVVVVNWNGGTEVVECIRTVFAQSRPADEVIIVDNASTDGSREAIESTFPTARLVRSETNRGFGGGVNLGVKAATSEWLALLNSDAMADPRWLEEMLHSVRASERFGMGACKIYLDRQGGILDKVGHRIGIDGQNFGCGHGLPDDGRYDERSEVAWPDGCASLWRRDVFNQVGGVDEEFFAYADDAGVIQIAAAGNTGQANDVQAPARFPQTIAVAATDNRDRHESFSSAGPEIDLAAPGWRIYSCVGSSSYGYKSGTSMAAPFVTGAVALMKTVAPDLDPVTAKVMLMIHADDVESLGFDDLTGTGRLDVEASLLALDPQPPAPGDLNRDGVVDGEDFGIMLMGWGPCPSDCEETCVGDLNGDCRIDGLDLGLLFVDWTG